MKKQVTQKSIVLSIRLNPRLHFALDLVHRDQQRPISNLIEWLLTEAVQQISITGGATAKDAADELWNVHEADRLIGLGLTYPRLLTAAESMLLEVVKSDKKLWRGGKVSFANLNREKLRDEWPEITEKTITALERNVRQSFKFQIESLKKR